MNTTELQGKILRIYNGKNVSIVTLFVGGTKRPNYPHVFFNKSDKAVLFDFQEGDYVNIRCAVKTRRVTEEDEKTSYEQNIKGLSIEKVKSEMEEKFGVEMNGEGRHEYKNEVLIKGTVANVVPKKGITHLLIRPEGEKFNVWMTSYAPDREALAELYPVGSTIYAKGRVQTDRRRRNGVVRDFESLILMEHHKSEDTPVDAA